MPKCEQCGYELSELDKQCPRCARLTPTEERIIVTCPHCGQKNRLPAGRAGGTKVVCGRCKHDLTSRAESATAQAAQGAVETELPEPPKVEETYLADVSGPSAGPSLDYISPGDELGDPTVAAIPESEVSAVETLDRLISEALAMRATDIHVEADAQKTRVRYRVDGHLREAHSLPRSVRAPLVSRLKVLARLDIVERRLPQDGSFRVKRGRDEIDVRLSTLPSYEGESAALRLLSHAVRLRALGELGLEKEDHDALLNSVYRPEGLILVTGPTGSGKTTTLYAVLALLSSIERKIITLEDPIEYRLPMISQTAINPDIGFDFARGLRHILRHDPDIILVGEIRDRETAEIAVQAALTGHLLFSTLHTAGTAEAIVRLLELGIEVAVGALMMAVRHAYTHFHVTIHVFHCRYLSGEPQALGCADWRWVRPDELDDFAFPAADRRVIAALWEM